MIWPISRLCSAIAITSNVPLMRLYLTADRNVSLTTAYVTEEPDEALASPPVLKTSHSREEATYFNIQFLVEGR